MSTIELLTQRAINLPDVLQREVLDFVDYLLEKYKGTESFEEKEWSAFSMRNAQRGFEDDPVTYSHTDIKSS